MMQRIRRWWRRRKDKAAIPVPADWRVVVKKRIAVACAGLALWVVGIEARLVTLQVIERADLVARAARQQMRTIYPPAKRGDIVDRRGRMLATSVDADTVYAVPSEIGDEPAAVAKLCQALGDCTGKERQTLLERLGKQSAFAYVRRQVSPEQAERIAKLNLDGIGFMKESRRFYPNRELASHVLGYVGIDNKGLGGVEAAYESQITGKPGQILVYTDARRHAFNRFERPPTAGSSIELTIDEFVQHVAERELHTGVVENNARGGSAIVMDPRTGEILALANEPTFNPNAYREAEETARRNRGVQDLYEPGSTFKVVTASAAIDEKVLPLDTMIDVSGGQIHIGSRVVHDTHNYGVLSFTDVIVKSSNVGAIKIGFKLGTDRLSDYVARYGFGQRVSPDFPAENAGIVWDRTTWTDSALASVSMGYQIGVTPLQMVAAVSSVANGGEYVQPRALRAVYRDGRRYVIKPRVLRRTVSPDTAAAMTTIMEQVVGRGTGTAAKMPDYTIAGKTGTANKLINGRYSSETYASFVGFVPSRNPAIAVVVVLDSPRGRNGHFGGPVSAPIFKRIAQATLQYMGVAPTISPAPPVLVARKPASELPPQVPTAAESPAPAVTLVTADTPGTFPDLRGMSAREAVRTLMKAGLTARVSGDGIVVAQNPLPGAPAEEAAVCQLFLDRGVPKQLSAAAQP